MHPENLPMFNDTLLLLYKLSHHLMEFCRDIESKQGYRNLEKRPQVMQQQARAQSVPDTDPSWREAESYHSSVNSISVLCAYIY